MASRGPPARARHCHPDRGAGSCRGRLADEAHATRGRCSCRGLAPQAAPPARTPIPGGGGPCLAPPAAPPARTPIPGGGRGRAPSDAAVGTARGPRCGRDSLAMRNVCGNSYQTRGRSVGVQLPTPNRAFLSSLLASRRTHDLQGSSFPSSVPHSLCGWSPPTTASPCATQAVAAEGTGYFRQGDYIQEGQRCTSRIQQSG